MERVERVVIVKNVHGLHARPAAVFVQLANKFDSWVILEKGGERVDGKSIIALLSLGVHPGAEVKLIIEGSDALDAFNELKKFLESGND